MSFAPPDEMEVAKHNLAKRQQMESVGFSIAYDNIDLNEEELDEIADAMDEIDDEMNS